MGYFEESLYIAAGSSPDVKLQDFFSYNLADETWHDLSHPTDTYEEVMLAGVAVDRSFFYLFYGWSRTKEKDLDKIFRVNLKSSNQYYWEEVAVNVQGTLPGNEPVARDSFGYAKVGSVFYMFAGFTSKGITNSLLALNLEVASVELTVVPPLKSPPLRIYHSLEAIHGKLYLFGGDTGTSKLEDLWEFDPSINTWRSIKGSGDLPSPRSHHASSAQGDTMIIWGGNGADGLLDDMYKYTVSTNTWERMVPVSDNAPSPRFSPCIVLWTPLIYLYGGYGDGALSSELWVYNTGTLEYSLLSTDSALGPGPLHKHVCSTESQLGEILKLYVMFGTGEADEAKGDVHFYNMTTGTWTKEYSSEKKRNAALVQKIARKVVVGGGETWGITPHKEFFYIDLDTASEHSLGELDEFFIAGGHVYLGSELYFHGGAAPLSDIYRATAPKNSFFKFDLRSTCGETSCRWECSLGSYFRTDACALCPKGLYRESFDTSDCYPCPAGFFNEFIGASSQKQCVPCPERFFNPDPGASYCLYCPSGAVCPIGTSKLTYIQSSTELVSMQPGHLKSHEDEAREASFCMMLLPGLVGAIILLIFALFPESQNLLLKIDIFSRFHVVSSDKYFKLKRNKIGGCFSILFFVVFATLIGSTLPFYAIDNTEETKTLVPFTIMEDSTEFRGDIRINVVLEKYRAPCETAENACDSSIEISFKGSLAKHESSCHAEGANCSIELMLPDCEVSNDFTVDLQLRDSNSYSSAIFVNVTAFSSIPKEVSSVTQSVSSEKDKVFRGFPPSIFTFDLITSLYKDSVKDSKITGFHVVQTNDPQPGQTSYTNQVPFTTDLLIQLKLFRSVNSLITIRERSNSILLYFIILVGAFAGTYVILGKIMACYERVYKSFYRLYKQKVTKARVNENRELIKNYLSSVEQPSSEVISPRSPQTGVPFFPVETEFKEKIMQLNDYKA